MSQTQTMNLKRLIADYKIDPAALVEFGWRISILPDSEVDGSLVNAFLLTEGQSFHTLAFEYTAFDLAESKSTQTDDPFHAILYGVRYSYVLVVTTAFTRAAFLDVSEERLCLCGPRVSLEIFDVPKDMKQHQHLFFRAISFPWIEKERILEMVDRDEKFLGRYKHCFVSPS